MSAIQEPRRAMGRRRRLPWRRVNDATWDAMWAMKRVLAILEGIDRHPDRHPDPDLVRRAQQLLRKALDDLDPTA